MLKTQYTSVFGVDLGSHRRIKTDLNKRPFACAARRKVFAAVRLKAIRYLDGHFKNIIRFAILR